VVLSGAGVLMLGLVVSVGWTCRHASAFEDYGGWGVGHDDWRVRETAYVGITFPGDNASGSVTIHGADPHGLADSTGAKFAYFLCTPKPDPAGAASGVGSEFDAHEQCGDLVPADDALMSLAEQQLVVAITPGNEGVVAFHGLDLRYSEGWQNGTQRVGGDVQIQVRDHN
jgi:hypothetical protein